MRRRDVLASAAAAQTALPFAEVVAAALVDEGAITVKGSFTCPPEFQGGKHRGGAVGSTMGFSYAAQVVEVSVDEATGLVTVDKVWAALDCGHAINPLAVVGQIEGSVWMGMGQAMCEETRYLDGLPAHASFLDYRMPTIGGIAADRGADRRKPRSVTARSAPRRRAKARWRAFRRRWSTPSPTRSASISTNCR